MNSEFNPLLRVVILLAIANCFGNAIAFAETVYVTDQLQLEMYLTPDLSGAPVRKLRSGDTLELLERSGRYANVRAEDGQAGWVKSLYLVDIEPARTRVNKLEKSNKGLEATVKKLRTQLASQKDKVAELQGQQDGAAEQSASAVAEVARLTQENEDLVAKLGSYAGSVPVKWMLIGLLVALAGGLASGWYFIDRRSRQKHGGYRIY